MSTNKQPASFHRFMLQICFFGWLLAFFLVRTVNSESWVLREAITPADLLIGPNTCFFPLIVNHWTSPPPLLISEVLYNPSETEPAAEWIEVYNYGLKVEELSGYMIGDSHEEGGHEGMYIFPAGAVMSPGEAIIIAPYASVFEAINGFKPDFELRNSDNSVPDMIMNSAWAEGFMSLNNAGDEVFLLFISGEPIDLVSWGDSIHAFFPSVETVDEGHSIERYPPYADTDSNLDWRDQPNPSPGVVDLTPPPIPIPFTATPTTSQTPTLTFPSDTTPTPTNTSTATPTSTPTQTPTSTPLVDLHILISEVLYLPIDRSENEWIEIYNPMPESIELSNYKIGDEENSGGNEGMLQFPPEAVLQASDWIVIASNAVNFHNYCGFKPDYEMEESDETVLNMITYSVWASGIIDLDDTGDEVLLLNAGDSLIDALSYGTSIWAFDPSIPLVDAGHSIERYPGNIDTDSAGDWHDQASPNPGGIPCPGK